MGRALERGSILLDLSPNVHVITGHVQLRNGGGVRDYYGMKVRYASGVFSNFLRVSMPHGGALVGQP